MSNDRHEPFRRLLAERLDDPLDETDSARLESHLVDCTACRSIAHDYEIDRERMRAIRAPEPPRDLWARTSAALDRELADDANAVLGRGLGGAGGGRQLRVAIGSFVTAMLVLALTGGQLMQDGPTGLATATPFAIPAQSVAYVGVADGELTFYRANVAEVCPIRRLDCADGPDGEPVARLGSGVLARDMAISQGGQLFISARDDLGEEVFAIVTLPSARTSGRSRRERPSSSVDPAATGEGGATIGPDDAATAEPTDGPDSLPTRPPDHDGAAAAPSITPPPSPGTAIASSHPILTDAIATGATAAWSRDGTTLAFSAMPADRSRGSDVYVWRPGDEQAHPITKDHASLFASWSGPRIVASRIEAHASGADDVMAETVVVDPASGDARTVDLERAWLPTVDPTGGFVIYWRGRLADLAEAATPVDGRLYIADWTSLDPWSSRDGAAGAHGATPADGAPAESTPPEAAAPAPVEGDTSGPAQDSADAASATEEPNAEVADRAPPADVPEAPSNGSEVTTTDDATASPSEDPDATAAPRSRQVPPSNMVPFVMERPRAVSGQTRDWVVRWSADGRAYAVWTAEPDSTMRGSLVVRSAPSGDAPTGVTLVDRVRASRSFGLGDQRVCWVAPLAGGHGELWVSVWGERGQGSVKLRRLESMEAVAAY
jgi:putative zinc finger protein